MLNPNEQEAIFQERKQQLLQAVKLHELYLRADRERPQFGDRLMSILGDLMITSGEKLKARAAVPCLPEAQHG